MSQCCHRKHKHDRGRVGLQHPFGRELLGLSFEETLAKREIPLHQEHDGTCSTFILTFILLL